MSAPLAGKFQDHYAVLGIDPTADGERLSAAYAKLAEKYHPNNPDTGDREKFDAVNMAYEVLSDPALRKEFDKLKGLDQGEEPKFTGVGFFEALGRENNLRVAVLCVLYDRRRTKPSRPSLSMRQLESTLQATEEELNFALWYLKKRSYVGQDDKSSLLINVEGMDFLETLRPGADVVMPFIKAAPLAVKGDGAPVTVVEPAQEEAAPPPTPVAPKPLEPVQNILRRARARG